MVQRRTISATDELFGKRFLQQILKKRVGETPKVIEKYTVTNYRPEILWHAARFRRRVTWNHLKACLRFCRNGWRAEKKFRRNDVSILSTFYLPYWTRSRGFAESSKKWSALSAWSGSQSCPIKVDIRCNHGTVFLALFENDPSVGRSSRYDRPV